MNVKLGNLEFSASFSISKNIIHEGKNLVDNIKAVGNSSIKLKDCFTSAEGDNIAITSEKGNIEIAGSDNHSNINGDVSSKAGKITLKNISIRNVEIKKGGLEMEHCHINGTLSIIGTETDKIPESGAHNLKIGAYSVINNIHIKGKEYDDSSWLTRKFGTPNFISNIFRLTAEFSRRTDQTESTIPLKSNVTLDVNSELKSITLDKGISCTLVVPDSARFDGDIHAPGLTVIKNESCATG